MDDTQRPAGEPERAAGHDPIITHDDGEVIELPAPRASPVSDADQRLDDDGSPAQQPPGLDPRSAMGAGEPGGEPNAEGDPGVG